MTIEIDVLTDPIAGLEEHGSRAPQLSRARFFFVFATLNLVLAIKYVHSRDWDFH